MMKFSTIEPNGVPNVPNKLKIINYCQEVPVFTKKNESLKTVQNCFHVQPELSSL